MHQYLPELLTIAALHLLAVMSPGPDFIMVSKNSLTVSRRAGIFTALGLALGITVHITYSLVGLAYIISQSIIIFSTLKFLGAAYLIYIGYKALRSRPNNSTIEDLMEAKTLSRLAAVKMGFLTNILNPKVTLFFLAIFTQVIQPTTPVVVKILYGLEISGMTFLWFTIVATILSHKKITKRFVKIQHHLERVMGAALILLGLKVALSKR